MNEEQSNLNQLQTCAQDRPETQPDPGESQPGASLRTPPVPYPKIRASGRDLALAGVLLIFCFLLWDALFWADGLGLGEAIGLAALLPAALIYLRDREGRLKGYGLACAVLYELGAVSLAFSADDTLKYLTVLALIPLFLIVILERLNLRTGLSLRARLNDLFSAAFAMTFGRLGAGSWALSHSGREDSVHVRRVRASLVGLLCAVPALLVVIPLLVSSDAAFAGLIGKLDMSSAIRGLISLAVGGFTALMLFSLLFTSDRGPRGLAGTPRSGSEPAAIAAFLGAISAAYVLYLVSQFAYFTDAFRGLLPKDYTVAQYARRGFFEMFAIVAINLGLIVLALGLVRKQEERIPGAVKGLALFLCLFSIALVATALSKMVLYMGSFGLTRLRVLTSVFMVFLAVVLAAEGLKLFVRRVPVIQLAVTAGTLVLILLSLANVDGVVARYNVDAYRTGKLDSLDVDTVCFLGDGAVPSLIELTQDENKTISGKAEKELENRLVRKQMAERKGEELVPTGTGWDLRSWNLTGQRARDALEDYQNRNK